jgi:ubiquinone/menaquinone biosynthesis C-methylase UbiE
LSGFDRVADIYDATRSLRPDVTKQVVDGIEDFVRGLSVVDVGIGTGRVAAPLVERGVGIVGIDVSIPMIRQARDKGVGGLVVATAEPIPLRAQSFDYAIVAHFMHLVKDWKAVVKEIARVSRKGLIAVVDDLGGSRPRDLYVKLRENRGFPMAGLRLGEREMMGMVKPSLTRKLSGYTEEFDPSELMDEYDAKLHSITWDVPDGINAQIVKEMRSRLGGRRETARNVSLAVWDSDRLSSFYPSP